MIKFTFNDMPVSCDTPAEAAAFLTAVSKVMTAKTETTSSTKATRTRSKNEYRKVIDKNGHTRHIPSRRSRWTPEEVNYLITELHDKQTPVAKVTNDSYLMQGHTKSAVYQVATSIRRGGSGFYSTRLAKLYKEQMAKRGGTAQKTPATTPMGSYRDPSFASSFQGTGTEA